VSSDDPTRSNDPYAAPTADLSTDAAALQTSIWNAKGRLGVLSHLAQLFAWSLLLLVLAAVVIGVASLLAGGMGALTTAFESGNFGSPAVLLPLLVFVPLFFISLYVYVCLLIKRLHDRNHSGWWSLPLILISLIPILGMLVYLYVLLWPGNKHANRFGGQRITKGWEKVLGIIYLIILVGMVVFSFAAVGTALLGLSV